MPRLDEIADMFGGYSFKSSDLGSAGVAVVKIADINPPIVSLASCQRVSPSKAVGLSRYLLKDRDIVMAMTGATTGKVGRYRGIDNAYLNQRVAKLTAKLGPEFDDYVYAIVSQPGFEETVLNNASGSAQPNVSAEGIGRIEVPVLSRADQLSVGRIIAALDDKIELNRKMSATLETIARALFKSWFVDFDPVRAKAEGRDPGLPAEIAALFPDSFSNEGLRPIPVRWAIARLDDFANISGGKQLPTHECKKSGKHQVFGANGVMGYADRYTHDSFVAAFGRVGANCGSIHWTYEPSWINNNASAIAPERYPEYVLQTLLDIDFVSMRTGSAQPFIPNSSLAAAPILRAPNGLISEFCSMTRPMRLRQGTLHAESRTLAALRDALLPKLISGELRAGEADRVLAASA